MMNFEMIIGYRYVYDFTIIHTGYILEFENGIVILVRLFNLKDSNLGLYFMHEF